MKQQLFYDAYNLYFYIIFLQISFMFYDAQNLHFCVVFPQAMMP